jgi:hypothetical protein
MDKEACIQSALTADFPQLYEDFGSVLATG